MIADPVLDPPALGLASSLREYILFREAHPTIPLFFGVGNVTELLDADSTGANALLAALGAEIGASLLFTPEYSAKARGSVHELAIASRMMILAQWRQTPPKDLGLDLLILKEKRRLPEEPMPGAVHAKPEMSTNTNQTVPEASEYSSPRERSWPKTAASLWQALVRRTS